MRKLICLFLLLSMTFQYAAFAQDMELDEILENYFEVAGTDKVKELKTLQMTGKMIQMGAQEFPFLLMQKRPKKIRIESEVQGNKMIQAYNGKTGWMIAPWTGSLAPQDMNDEQVKGLDEQADFEGELYNWEEKGHKLELLGTEDMEGTETYKLKLTKKEGDEQMFFIDAEAFVVLKVASKRKVRDQEVEMETYLSNYKQVDGMAFPFNIDNKMKGQVVNQIVVDKIEFDVDLDDKLFEKPEIKPQETKKID